MYQNLYILTVSFLLTFKLSNAQIETNQRIFEGYYYSRSETSSFFELKEGKIYKSIWLDFDASLNKTNCLIYILSSEVLRKGIYIKFEGKKIINGNFGHLGASKEMVIINKILVIDTLKTIDKFLSKKNSVLKNCASFIDTFTGMELYNFVDSLPKDREVEIKIIWADNLGGDFSFTEKWNYPEGVYKNDFGQLSCDGNCPPEIHRMKNENSEIYKDSLVLFYQLVDTTHYFYSIQSEAWAYEWAGTNYVTATRKNEDTTICFTHNNVATHSSLILTITKNKCIPIIELFSIKSSVGKRIYIGKSGQIEIDKNLWEKGILKANFDFEFDHKENPSQPMYWKGKIYASINNF